MSNRQSAQLRFRSDAKIDNKPRSRYNRDKIYTLAR